ncbi:hypothetical protein OB986_28575 [Bacillus cereus]|nr:hypothetical protein [Bacillus cereus]HDR8053995.1 hypothetical protein [Bacillus cereus]
MAYGDIPEVVRQRLASNRVRMYHGLWHFVRNENEWNNMDPAVRELLIEQGWKAPRFENQPGSGIDFLYMHRQMIAMVNAWGAEDNNPDGEHGEHGGHGHHSNKKDIVIPWLDIPWDHNDPVWPMPQVTNPDPNIFGPTKEQETTNTALQRVNERYANRTWLRTVTLDSFGTELERGIHGWMHMHWSTEPPANPNNLDISNDWLGSPFSSHINKHFWKLHGWIDNRITAWEDANGVEADLTQGWDGPPDYVTGEPHSASPELFSLLNFAERKPLLMPWKGLLLEN